MVKEHNKIIPNLTKIRVKVEKSPNKTKTKKKTQKLGETGKHTQNKEKTHKKREKTL